MIAGVSRTTAVRAALAREGQDAPPPGTPFLGTQTALSEGRLCCKRDAISDRLRSRPR